MNNEFRAIVEKDADALQAASSVKLLRSIPAEPLELALATLRARGWSSMPLAPDHDLRSIIPLLRPQLADQVASIQVERVSPKTSSQARPGTMSAIYGMDSFPLHTERAHWPAPPRFLILRSVGDASDRPTTLLDSYRFALDQKLAQELLQTPWSVRWGEVSFRSWVLQSFSSGKGRWRIRYDRCCMIPFDEAHKGLLDRLEHALIALEPETHYWEPGIVLIIDNWRVLHGRGKCTGSDFGRSLERVVVP
jgi:alpha-ketoglutarate-dependent taurine dioxygenase